MAASQPMGTIVILSGGTGGHVFPALAVAAELRERGFSVHWVGTNRGLESRVVPAAGYPLHTLGVQGIRGKGLLYRLQAVVLLLTAICQSLYLLFSLRPRCVLGMGGYVAGPAGLAAWLLGKPLLIHEQNSVAGTTNRILSRFSRRIMAAYPNAFADRSDVLMVGNPVRLELMQAAALSPYNYTGDRPLRLLVVGGSLGARAINEALPPTLALMPVADALQVRHQTGVAHAEQVSAAYERQSPADVQVLPFIEDMAAAYAWADLVLCRAGALTIAELTIMQRPAVLVPLPQAIDNHQLYNARWLVEQGGARLLPQSELEPQTLATLLAQLCAAPADLAAMAQAAAAAARPEATVAVANICQEVSDGR